MNIGLGFFSLNKLYDEVRPDYDFDSISKVLIEEFASDTKLTGAEIGAGSGKFTSVLIKSLDFEELSIVDHEKAAIEKSLLVTIVGYTMLMLIQILLNLENIVLIVFL